MSGGNFNDDPNLNTAKLKERMDSLKSIQNNINNQVWNAQTDYYLSQGETGLTQLNDIKSKKITADYQVRKKQYEDMMDYLYSKYYDKLSVLYTQKSMTNKQIEIINNTQYKILEQRDVDNNLTNELTTKNREREYLDNIYRKQKKEIQLYSYLLGCFFLLVIIILVMNVNKFKEGNMSEVFYSLLYQSNKSFYPLYLVVVLFIIIVFRQFSLAILFLIVYAVITLIVDIPSELEKSNLMEELKKVI